MDQTAFFKLSYGLYLISSCFNGSQCGCVVNTLTQVTASPAKLSVTISKNNCTQKAIEQSGFFTGVVLTQAADMDLIGEFGFKSSTEVDKFSRFPHNIDKNGIAYVTQTAAARFSCKVTQQLDVGTHVIYVGEVTEAENLSAEEVMTYAYYHSVKKGTTPKNAPSYKEATEKKGFRCTVCGYIHESDALPEGFTCPVCGVARELFKKL